MFIYLQEEPMQHAAYDSGMPTGVAPLDHLQRDFYEAMKCLATAPDSEFIYQYGEFVKVAERTFRIEEAWMEELDCAIVCCHREQHARVLAALHNVHARVMDGDLAIGRDVAERLLPQWFALHAETMDAALGATIACVGANVSIDGAMTPQPIVTYTA
jgi:hemerythrin